MSEYDVSLDDTEPTPEREDGRTESITTPIRPNGRKWLQAEAERTGSSVEEIAVEVFRLGSIVYMRQHPESKAEQLVDGGDKRDDVPKDIA